MQINDTEILKHRSDALFCLGVLEGVLLTVAGSLGPETQNGITEATDIIYRYIKLEEIAKRSV